MRAGDYCAVIIGNHDELLVVWSTGREGKNDDD